MDIRTIKESEIKAFSHISDQKKHNEGFAKYLTELWVGGYSCVEWCFVAEVDGKFVGRVSFFGHAPNKPLEIDFLHLPWDGDYLKIGSELLRQSLEKLRSEGTESMNYNLHVKNISNLEKQIEVIENVGFSSIGEQIRFEWIGEDEPEPIPQRLTFQSMEETGEKDFIRTLERILVGSLDSEDQINTKKSEAKRTAIDTFQTLKTVCSHEPGWWQLAYTDSGTLVGLVMPARNDTSSIIGYIGVVPEQRGNGYINDLLHRATNLHYENGARRIVSDTDVENIPMANAFRRGGYKEFDEKLRYTIDL